MVLSMPKFYKLAVNQFHKLQSYFRQKLRNFFVSALLLIKKYLELCSLIILWLIIHIIVIITKNDNNTYCIY